MPQGGYGPSDFQTAYNLPATGSTATIAVVDAYGYTELESDLGMYRSMYGLPACTIANGCLRIVNQEGATSPLPTEASQQDDWTGETALDVDMASSACPTCKILVVQADDDQGDGLYVANNTAATLGAAVVSNSWGGPSSGSGAGGDESMETNFDHPGVSYFVAAGDSGYTGTAGDYPSTSQYVIAVGGTSLASTSPRTETVWDPSTGNGATGSTCSTAIAKPSYEAQTACKGRAASDVSADADPATGAAVYDSANGNGGFLQVGGTSQATPLVAGIFALTGHGSDHAPYVWANPTIWNDVTSGQNAVSASGGAVTCTTSCCQAGDVDRDLQGGHGLGWPDRPRHA